MKCMVTFGFLRFVDELLQCCCWQSSADFHQPKTYLNSESLFCECIVKNEAVL
jgi:hypothetical protein